MDIIRKLADTLDWLAKAICPHTECERSPYVNIQTGESLGQKCKNCGKWMA